MAYKTNPAPYQRTKKSTLQIMIELGIALAIVWLAAVITTFVKLGGGYGLKSILLMVVSVVVSLACDAINTILRNKKDKALGKKIVYDLIHNYSWITAMIFTLLCPVWTSYYVVIVGSIFATVIGKLVFGGFGKNIFNPAAMGRIFIQLCFDLSVPEALKDASGIYSGATATNAFNSAQQWLGTLEIGNFSIGDLLLGNYFGTMGETFTVLLLVLGIILAIRGVINWRAPVFYVGTVAVTTFIISLVLGFENPWLYVLYHLSLGGLMFGAVFMITDPVTTPTSPVGNCFVGIIAALLTVLIRVGTNNAEGVVYSIAIVNLISPAIDHFVTAKTGEKQGLKAGVTFGTSALTIILCTAMAWTSNGGREVNKINDLSRKEHDIISSLTDFDFVKEQKYSFATYKHNLPTNESLTEVEGISSAYSIVDENETEVGVVYCIKVDGIVIFNGYSEATKSATAFVAFSTEGKILEISFYKAPYVGGYEDKVKNGVDDFDWSTKTNEEIQNTPANEIISGATYSAEGVKKLVNAAYSVFNSSFGN